MIVSRRCTYMSSGKGILTGSSVNSTSTRIKRKETDSRTPPRAMVENLREASEVLPVPSVPLEPRKMVQLLPQLRRWWPMRRVAK